MVRSEDVLDFAAVPSRWRRRVLVAGGALVASVAALQALALEAPWPLLALALLPLLPRLCPELEAARLRVDGDALWVLAGEGPRCGVLDRPAAVTAVAVEVQVRWEGGRRERLVLWRDAVEDAAYRRLVRRLRRRPGSAARWDGLRMRPFVPGPPGARRGPRSRPGGSVRA